MVRITTKIAACWCNAALDTKLITQRASHYLATLGIRELRRSRDGRRGRVWFWHGKHAPPTAETVDLRDRPSTFGEGQG